MHIRGQFLVMISDEAIVEAPKHPPLTHMIDDGIGHIKDPSTLFNVCCLLRLS